MAPDVAEDRRPVHSERRCQLLDADTPTVGGDPLGHLVGSETPLARARGDERAGRVTGSLAGALPQPRPERRQSEHRAFD
ncbi:MAG: hypothetical protein ACRDYY_09190, partial [Acidimicrobiales bacterium]